MRRKSGKESKSEATWQRFARSERVRGRARVRARDIRQGIQLIIKTTGRKQLLCSKQDRAGLEHSAGEAKR